MSTVADLTSTGQVLLMATKVDAMLRATDLVRSSRRYCPAVKMLLASLLSHVPPPSVQSAYQSPQLPVGACVRLPLCDPPGPPERSTYRLTLSRHAQQLLDAHFQRLYQHLPGPIQRFRDGVPVRSRHLPLRFNVYLPTETFSYLFLCNPSAFLH